MSDSPRADLIVNSYLSKCDAIMPDGSSCEDIDRDLTWPIAKLERELNDARAELAAMEAAPAALIELGLRNQLRTAEAKLAESERQRAFVSADLREQRERAQEAEAQLADLADLTASVRENLWEITRAGAGNELSVRHALDALRLLDSGPGEGALD